MQKFRILLDLDGVLADFDRGACEVHRVPYMDMIAKRPLGKYLLGEAVGCKNAEEIKLPINEAGENFWYNLLPLPWFTKLLDLVKSITDDWHVVTDPGVFRGACGGKDRWIKKHFGGHFENFVLTANKHLLAKDKNVILIDDRERNCSKFIEAGGNAIIFPTQGNCYHPERFRPVAYVKQVLETITNEEG